MSVEELEDFEKLFGQQFTRKSSEESIEKTLAAIAENLTYRGEIKQLMQMARVSYNERRQYSILYALNKVRLIRAKTLDNYLFASLSLSVSERGKSREEVLEMGKASMNQIPLSIFQRLKGKMGFDV